MKKIVRNISSHLGTILSISLMLFLFGLILTALFVASDLSQHAQERINISVYLRQDLVAGQADTLRAELLATPAVKSVVFINQEQDLEALTKDLQLSKNPIEVLGYNPLFPMMNIHLNATYANNDSIANFETRLKKNEKVIGLQYLPTVVETVNNNITRIMLILSLLCTVFLFIAIILINNMVRLHIYARRFQFNIMKLVGADRNFILRNIVCEQAINGAIAAVPAIVTLLYWLRYIHRTTGESVGQPMFYVSVLMLALGVIVTSLATYFAAIYYLKRTTTDLYHS